MLLVVSAMAKNEVTPDNPELQRRFLSNPVAKWCGLYMQSDRRHPTPEMHLDFYDSMLSSAPKKRVTKAPRSFAKSTIKIKNRVVYQCCEYKKLAELGENAPVYPHKEIMIACANGKQARKWLSAIQTELRNKAIVEDYGDIFHPDKPCNQDEFWTKDGVHVVAYGAGYTFRGERPTLFLGDDLDNDESVRSDEQLEKLFDWWDKAVINMMDETFSEIDVTGTTIEEVTLLEHICEMSTFTVYHYGAYLKDEFGEFVLEPGYETWVSKWSDDRLKEKITEIGFRNFSAEFLNMPVSTEAPIMERHWFQTYDVESARYQRLLNNIAYTFLDCDPAISRKDGADFTALVTASVVNDNGKELIMLRTEGIEQGHWSLGRTVTRISNLYDKFLVNSVGVEVVAYQEALADEVESYMETQRRNITVEQVQVSMDKERRANSVAPLVERGLILYNPQDELHVKLIDQCVRFKAGKKNIKKDLMDAFVQMLGRYKRWNNSSITTDEPTIVRDSDNLRITGGIV